jgi:CubicO group peptidase (beta-lactamase class C family)
MLPNITDFDFEGIKRVFDQQIRDGLHHGAQLVVRRLGDVLIDFHAGFSDASKRIPITSETNFLTFSLTKPYTSVCIFKLVEEREINLEDPVGYYWPEFSCRGKEEMTIRQVLLHQSGLPTNRLVYQILNAPDWEKIIDDLAVQKPDFPPGTKTAYQLLNFGFILGEIIQRVTGSPVDEFLRQEFLAPLGLTRTTMRVLDFQDEQFARLSSRTLDHQVVAWIFNSRRMRGSLLPAASLHSTAREMAIFYQMLLNNGEYAGYRYLEPETVRLATSLGFEGYDESLGRRTRWGYGFFLGGDHVLQPEHVDGLGKGSSIDTFGHYGQRNSMVWADKRTGLVVVFLCNRFLSSNANKLRLQQISDAIWDAFDD